MHAAVGSQELLHGRLVDVGGQVCQLGLPTGIRNGHFLVSRPHLMQLIAGGFDRLFDRAALAQFSPTYGCDQVYINGSIFVTGLYLLHQLL
ncbi:hypothetical protein SDC9_158057 [bioreactor metagenome]|uniref:Uncharacterized protein n=1 Tax=bioreactor metagenome TaxID=1076179 RepID=A0A645FA27_9ZZZZ